MKLLRFLLKPCPDFLFLIKRHKQADQCYTNTTFFTILFDFCFLTVICPKTNSTVITFHGYNEHICMVP